MAGAVLVYFPTIYLLGGKGEGKQSGISYCSTVSVDQLDVETKSVFLIERQRGMLSSSEACFVWEFRIKSQ